MVRFCEGEPSHILSTPGRLAETIAVQPWTFQAKSSRFTLRIVYAVWVQKPRFWRDRGGCVPLDFVSALRENNVMVIHGRVHNGVVVLDGGLKLPEGMQVTISCLNAPSSEPPQRKRRVELPLVSSSRPGTLQLTGEQVAEFLDDHDVSS